jgi:hypothetical protein
MNYHCPQSEADTGGMETVRCYHSAVLIYGGKLLVTGGAGATLNISSAELYW